MTVGVVYRFVNKVNGKSYVGKTIHSLRERVISHRCSAKLKQTTPFHRALAKYGIENFEIQILEESVVDDVELCELEKFYIKYFNSRTTGNGYNLTDGGDGVAGLKRSPEDIERMRQTGKQRFVDNPQLREQFAETSRYVWQNEEYRKKNMTLCPLSREELQMMDEKTSWADLATKYDVSITTVKRWFKDANVVKLKYVQEGSKRKKWSVDDESMLMSLYSKGLLVREIAIQMNRSLVSIQKRIQLVCNRKSIERSRYRRKLK